MRIRIIEDTAGEYVVEYYGRSDTRIVTYRGPDLETAMATYHATCNMLEAPVRVIEETYI